jgi:uncharacterized protein
VTADSPSYPAHHRRLAIDIAERFALQHEIIYTHEMDRQEYRANPTNRCYFCKHELYTHLTRIAAARHAIVIDGNNADDRGDYRPGRQAAREFGVRSPLDEVNLTKDEIRELSRLAGLPTWDEPASACLSSRIPYHSEVTVEKLRTIELAEQAIRALGFRVCRVRHHDEMARIEIAREEMGRALDPGDRHRDGASAQGAWLSLRRSTCRVIARAVSAKVSRCFRFPSQTQQRAAEGVVERPQPDAFDAEQRAQSAALTGAGGTRSPAVPLPLLPTAPPVNRSHDRQRMNNVAFDVGEPDDCEAGTLEQQRSDDREWRLRSWLSTE